MEENDKALQRFAAVNYIHQLPGAIQARGSWEIAETTKHKQ